MITRKFLSSLNFRRFNETDFMGFAGVQSPVPFICDENPEFLVILDGDYCEVYLEEDLVGGAFEPRYTCENVSAIPYSYENENTIDLGSGKYDQRPGDPEYFASDL